MATWDSADLLTRLKDATGRPATDSALTSERAYRLLTDAHRAVAYTIAQHIPHTNYGAPVQLVTSDNKLYTLSGAAEWIGRILVMRSLIGDPLIEGAYDDPAADYTLEGTTGIRITANRTYSGDAPYVRYMAKPGDITDAIQPTLKPVDALDAVVWKAAALWARRGGFRDPRPYEEQADRILWGNAQTGEPGLIPAYKDMAEGVYSDWIPWYRGIGTP